MSFLLCGCTKQVVFLDKDLTTTKSDFDKFISSTGYSYRLKDDIKKAFQPIAKIAYIYNGGDGGNRTHVQNGFKQISTGVVNY